VRRGLRPPQPHPQETIIRNPAKGEQGFESPKSGPAKPSCVGFPRCARDYVAQHPVAKRRDKFPSSPPESLSPSFVGFPRFARDRVVQHPEAPRSAPERSRGEAEGRSRKSHRRLWNPSPERLRSFRWLRAPAIYSRVAEARRFPATPYAQKPRSHPRATLSPKEFKSLSRSLRSSAGHRWVFLARPAKASRKTPGDAKERIHFLFNLSS